MSPLSPTEKLSSAKNFLKRGESKKALNLLSEIIEEGQGEKEVLSESYFHLGSLFHSRGEIAKAIKAFEKVLELEPNHTDAAISLSVLYNDIGSYESARKVFQSADERVKNRPVEGVDDPHVNKKFSVKHFELAELYMSYNRFDEALFEYNKAITLDGTNLEARLKVAKVYAKKNYLSKAFDELKRLKTEHPNHMPARIALGILHYGSGDVLAAQAEWQKVLAKEPGHSEALMYLDLSKSATETSL